MESLYRTVAIYFAGDKWEEMSPEQKEISQNFAKMFCMNMGLVIMASILAIGLFVSLAFTCKLYSDKIELQQQIQELQEKQPIIDNPIKIEDQSNE